MKFWPFQRKALSINQVIERLEAIYQSKSGVSVTPENCMRAPTVHAIVTAVSRRVSVSPVMVFEKTTAAGKDSKIPQPDHPVSRVLQSPNDSQDRVTFWLDMTSQLLRYGNMFAFISRSRRRILRLIPVDAAHTRGKLEPGSNQVVYDSTKDGGVPVQYRSAELVHARGAARDFINGDSPISDIKEAIAMEIAAEEYGATFFGNGAVPLLVFQIMAGFKDMKTIEEQKAFVESVREALGGSQRHKAFLLPKGIELADAAKSAVSNNQAQFIESRKYQRTVIAGAYGVPVHLVGDLERATFNNVEQQDSDFTINVTLPTVRTIEAAAEQSLLTPTEREAGLIIRFNLDAIQRADFKSRQEGLQIQRLNGVISANEWREMENKNPITEDDGGDDYWRPSNYTLPGEDETEDNGNDQPILDDTADDQGANAPPN
jgi:HK97 family phage portal protein